MPGQTDFVAVADGLIAGTADDAGARSVRGAARCGVVAFPRQASCAACTSRDVEERRARPSRARCGPGRSSASRPSPRRTRAAAEDFEPYGVGYVELPGEVRVEARLTEADPARLRIGMPMELVLVPAPGDGGAVTFAFRPAEDRE